MMHMPTRMLVPRASVSEDVAVDATGHTPNSFCALLRRVSLTARLFVCSLDARMQAVHRILREQENASQMLLNVVLGLGPVMGVYFVRG